jgi:hypothetical protein
MTSYSDCKPITVGMALTTPLEDTENWVKVRVIYPEFDYLQGMTPGHYEGLGTEVSERVGAYSDYSAWRNLVTMAVFGVSFDEYCNCSESYGTKPFRALLYNSDCEGCISGAVCAGLAADFIAFAPVFREYAASVDEGYIEIYDRIQRVVENAAPSGFLCLN